MNLKTSQFAIQDKNMRDIDYAEDYPTVADLIKEQAVSKKELNTDTVHHRRDLDSIG